MGRAGGGRGTFIVPTKERLADLRTAEGTGPRRRRPTCAGLPARNG
jgi:hypothetical protein